MSHSTSLDLSTPSYEKSSKVLNQHQSGDKIMMQSPESQVRIHLMAGAAAGVMEHCVMYPVDSVKTRMQSLRPHPKAVYHSVQHAFKSIVATEGFMRPLRGINIVALGAGPAHAFYFSSYEGFKRLLGNNGRGGHFPLANATAGVIATVFHDGAMNPVEVIKQRLQVYGSPYRGVFHCARTVWRNEGVSAFYRSFTTQLTMNIPFQCIHFVIYEFLREILNPAGGYNPKTHLVSGALAGGIAAACTTPLDVAKTLLNTQEKRVLSEIGSVSRNTYVPGMLSAMRTVYAMHGLRGYLRGVQARVIYQVPSCAICWSVYEFFKHNLSLDITDDELMELTV